jgi:hypothetical protein
MEKRRDRKSHIQPAPYPVGNCQRGQKQNRAGRKLERFLRREEAGVNGSETLQGAGLRKDERLAGGQELISEDQDSTLH